MRRILDRSRDRGCARGTSDDGGYQVRRVELSGRSSRARTKLALMHSDECGREADSGARGWRAYLGEEDDGSLMVGVFCPRCAEREFRDEPV
jgi:hypothetical protein